MKLSEQEAHEYYNLMWGLQFFANQELDVVPDLEIVEDYPLLTQKEKLDVRNGLFEHPELIDRFVEENPLSWPKAELDIVASWKHFIKGEFYVERMLKKHAIFIHGDQVYAVLALLDSLDVFFDRRELPLYVHTVLLPFKGRIIYDGLIQTYGLYFGGGIKADLKEVYMAAKQNRRIITSLGDGAARDPDDIPIVLPDWTPQVEELMAIARRLRSSTGAPPIWSPAFSLIRATLELAELAVREPEDADELSYLGDKVEKALDRVQTVLYRMEM